MNQIPQDPVFDTARLAEQLATTITAEIAAHLRTAGRVDDHQLRTVVDEHLAGALRGLTEDGLVPVLAAVRGLVTAACARDEQLLNDPRYAGAPEVTATVYFQQWTGPREDQLQPVGLPEDVVIPAAWLARQDREALERTADGASDSDWIAEDLGLLDGHDGPFDLYLDVDGESGKSMLELWLEATTVQD